MRMVVHMGVLLWAAAGASAQVASFASGTIGGSGFPGPLVNNANAVQNSGGSGGGSTGGGVGQASAAAQIASSASEVNVTLTGSARHSDQLNGYTGAESQDELILRITAPQTFTITSGSTLAGGAIRPVIVRAITGTITGDINVSGTLSPGDYGIRFAIAAGNRSSFPTSFNLSYAGYANVASGYYASASLNWRLTMRPVCYGNCDGSTAAPALNALDFICFLQRYRQALALPSAQQPASYANCDGSTSAPVLNALDFNCFLTRFQQGCQ